MILRVLLLFLTSVHAFADVNKGIPIMTPKGIVYMTDEQYWAYVAPMDHLPSMSFEFIFGKDPHPGYHVVHDRSGRAFNQLNPVPPPLNAPWLHGYYPASMRPAWAARQAK